MFNRLSLDSSLMFDDGCGSAEVGVGGHHIAQVHTLAPMVVVL